MEPVRDDADIVIVGGGVIGISIAFHLTQMGHSKVIVVERGEIGEGATSQATGGIRQQFTSKINARLVRRSLDFFSAFQDRTGEPFNFRQHGYLFLLTTERQWEVFSRAVQMQNALDIPSRTMTPAEVRAGFAGIDVDDLVGATYCPTDGSGSPYDAVTGMARAATRAGARIVRHTKVTGFLRSRQGRVTGVKTPTGELNAAAVIIAAGPQSREVGRLAGVELPVAPHRRQAFAVKGTDWMGDRYPLTVDVTTGAYIHPEREGNAVIGGNDRSVPEGTSTAVDRSLLEPLLEALVHRWPSMAEAQVSRAWAGLREMTPDDHAIVGAVPHTPGLWAAVGFSGHGFMQAPAVGEAMAQLLLHGESDIDLEPLRPTRFSENEPVVEDVLF